MYYSFIINRSEDDEDFEQFIILKIYQETSGTFSINKIPCKLNFESFRTVFIYNNHEINIQKLNFFEYKITIYPLANYTYTTPNIKFGCELETCLSVDCIEDKRKDISFDKLLNSKTEVEHKNNWCNLLILYIKDVIVPNTTKEFLNKFPKAYIALNPKSGYSDYVINFATSKYEKIKLPILHEYITFTRDSSVKCGDLLNKDKNANEYTFHCEIISPTLNNINDIILMYDTIIRPGCLESNNTTGFHINVSFDTHQDRPIYFTFGFIDTFLKYFEDYERKNYRANETKYANKIFTSVIEYTLNKYGDMLYYDNKPNNLFTYDNFIDNEKYYRCYIDLSEKYNSIYLKTPTLLEFRLFSSKSEMIPLINYITSVSNNLIGVYNDFIDNKEKIIYNLQKLNLKAQIDYNPLKSYYGKLFYEDEDFPILHTFEIKNNDIQKNLEKSLKFLFLKRGQIYVNHEDVKFAKLNTFILYTKHNKLKYEYNMSINKNSVATITLKNTI